MNICIKKINGKSRRIVTGMNGAFLTNEQLKHQIILLEETMSLYKEEHITEQMISVHNKNLDIHLNTGCEFISPISSNT